MILACLFAYDTMWGQADGLLGGFNFFRLWLVGQVVLLFGSLTILGMASERRAVQNISLFAFSTGATFLFLELIVCAFSWLWLSDVKPNHHLLTGASKLELPERPFWGDYHPDVSKWYTPHDSLERINCQGDSLYSTTNSVGARDKERSQKSDESRAVFLGDSFIEGFMVNAEDRLTDLLEQETGREHLNFGINGTSPINYYLNYKHLAKKFDHDAVFIGILPGNDFEDFTADHKKNLIENPIYRPYWDGRYPNFELQYSLASLDQSAHSRHHFENPEKMRYVVDSVFAKLPGKDKSIAFLRDNSYLWNLVEWVKNQKPTKLPKDFSRFNHYTRQEWEVFLFSIEKLIEEAEGKRVVLVLLPILNDLKAYDRTRNNTLAKELTPILNRHSNVRMISLLEIMHEHPDKWEDFYVLCDGHWSAEGEKFASKALLNHPVYREAMQLEPAESK